MSQRPPMVGRGGELDLLRTLFDRSLNGRGQLVLVAGEAGIGKSRLAEELAAEADQHTVVWGRCWEAGGAPSYWPFRQALTSLRRAASEAETLLRRPELLAFLGEMPKDGELGTHLADLDPERARFVLMEAVSNVLVELSRSAPLLIVLEDLHTADNASLSLLDFLEPHLLHSRVLLIGTYRPLEVAQQAPQLQRLAQRATTVTLKPLEREAIAQYLEHRIRAGVDDATVDEVALATEGNPLFLDEVSQVIGREPSRSPTSLLAPSVQGLINERLSTNLEQDVQLLRTASILGREFRLEDLAALSDDDEPTLEDALERLLRKSALERVGLHGYRFSHILIREALYHQLPVNSRRQLHEAWARILQDRAQHGQLDAWTEVAHHFLAADAFGDAIGALEKAAHSALEQLAFDDAVSLVERALDRLPPQADARRRAALLLLLAHARLSAGYVTSGRAACYEVARIAAQLGSPQLLAQAALQCGSVYVFAKVDTRMVGLLDDALRALPLEDVAMRAEVSARLAAALQPSREPEKPFALARQAIELARSQSDQQLLLRVLRSAVSALMDLGPPEERLALNREYSALALALNRPVDAWRAECRLVFDHFELGLLDGAYDALANVVALAERLDDPDYLWRALAMRAMATTFRGRFAEAHSLFQQAEQIAKDARDPNWRRAHASAQCAWHRAQGQRLPERHVDLISSLYEAEPYGQMTVWGEWARSGQHDQLRAAIDPDVLRLSLRIGDTTMLQESAHVLIALGDKALLEECFERIKPHAARFVSGGMTALSWEPPLSRELGAVAAALGRREEAIAYLDQALKAVSAAGGRAYAGFIEVELAAQLLAGPTPAEAERARELLESAARTATALGLPELSAATHRLLSQQVETEDSPPSSRAFPTRTPVRMRLEGELWCLRFRAETVRLANIKGMRLLAQLTEEPGREFHVLDLEQPGTPSDSGELGAALDNQARGAYQRRLAELEGELNEARAWNDTGRVSKLQEELQTLTQELSRAFGLSGRARPVGSRVERARVNVQRRLKDAIKRVRICSPEAAKHLERSVRTGTYCTYEP